MGRNGNLRDTFGPSKLQYRNEQDQWIDLGFDFAGNEPTIAVSGLDLSVMGARRRANRLIAKTNDWKDTMWDWAQRNDLNDIRSNQMNSINNN
jgi:hypothetical protein